MKQRGRPPSPGLLTPREEEVLALIRRGLSNREIAAQLGISLQGVKYHVTEILGKLGVQTREQAATWREDARPRRWAMFPQIFSLTAARAAVGSIGVPKLAAMLLLPAALLGAGAGVYAVLQTSEATQPAVFVRQEGTQDPCVTLLTRQCMGDEVQNFTTLDDAVAVASFQPSLPAYIPEGYHPVAIRHTRPEDTTQFVQSEDFKRGCPGCDPRMSHNDQIGIYYRNAAGEQLAVLQGFPATLLIYDQAPEDKKGIAHVGDTQIYWHRFLGPENQITLYWEVGRVGSGWAKNPDGSVVYGSPMSYSITSNGLELEELLKIVASVSFE